MTGEIKMREYRIVTRKGKYKIEERMIDAASEYWGVADFEFYNSLEEAQTKMAQLIELNDLIYGYWEVVA
jgi:hypothetical protein